MKTRILSQWIIRVLLILVFAGNTLSVPAQPASAKPLSAPFTNCAAPAQTQIPESECLALVALYTSTNGAGWITNTDWLQTNTPCSWHGIGCANGTNVTQLILDNNQLTGSLPSELGNLTNLIWLGLRDNQLSGPIPPQLGNLIDLEGLTLARNQLTNTIPPQLGNLTNLTVLNLHSNQLSGSIPPQLGDLTNLTGLYLFFNQLTGSIPPQLGNLTNLTALEIANPLTGPIPPELGNLTKLTSLDLGANLSGPIPAELGNLTELNELWLANNQLTGPIPPELGNLTKLTSLWMHDNLLSGEIPSSITSLTGLTTLTLSCGLTSTDPTVIAFLNTKSPGWQDNQCPIITEGASTSVTMSKNGSPTAFSLTLHATDANAGNILTWSIITQASHGTASASGTGNSKAIGYTPHTNYTGLDSFAVQVSDGNQGKDIITVNVTIGTTSPACQNITGIPFTECEALETLYDATNGASWTNKTGWFQTNTPCSWYGVTCHEDGYIINLRLPSNNLTGDLPSALSPLSHLTVLDFHNNHLVGTIPASFGALPQLRSLRLSSNQLTGDIPVGLGALSQLQGLLLYDNQLTGGIPPQLANLSQLTNLQLYSNQLAGSIPPELGTLSQLTDLYLGDNQLTGTIPSQLGNLSQLDILFLGMNQLTGGIPPELGDLSSLTGLDLSENLLMGSIPGELGDLSNLTYLYLGGNQLRDSLPFSLGNLTELTELELGQNLLSGEIPSSITNLVNLTSLQLSCRLRSTNPTVIAFLDQKSPGWQSNQCPLGHKELVVTPKYNLVSVYQWPMGATINVDINDPAFVPPTPVVVDQAIENIFLNFDIKPGQIVSVTDGSTTYKHIVGSVKITEVNPAENTISGMADSGSEIVLIVLSETDTSCNRVTNTKADGTWLVDVSIAENAGEVVCDLGPGSFGEIRQEDLNNNATMDDWNINNERFHVQMVENSIEGLGWTDGASITATVNDPGNGTGVDFTGTQVSNNGWVLFTGLGGLDLGPGMVVTMTDGILVKSHTIENLIVTDVDVEADTVSGTGKPGLQVSAQYCEEDNGCTWFRRWTTVQPNNTWSVDFSTPGTGGDEQGILNILPTTIGEALWSDDDGDHTDYAWFTGGSISGTVRNQANNPIANAEVCAHYYDGSPVGNCGTSLSNGSYKIPILPVGNYRVDAHSSGYAWEYYNNTVNPSLATPVSVNDGGITPNINFVLEPGGNISGHVYQADGTTPVTNMAVGLLAENGEEMAQVCSGTTGHFMFSSLLRGMEWRVSAVPSWRCDGQPEGYVHEYWQNARSWDAATPIVLSPSQPNFDGVVFTLDQGETTSGVVDTSGGTVETGEVSLDVPSGAISDEVTFTITDGGSEYMVETNQANVDAVISSTIGPEGTTFATPATLTFNWPDTNNDGFVDGTTFNENDLYLSKDGMVIAGPCATDTTHCNKTANTFTVQVSSLSDFVIGVPSVAPTVSSIIRASGSSTTNASSVDFTVTFSEAVAGVDKADFKLTSTFLTNASITDVSSSGDTYTVTVNTGTGNGTIRLDIPATASIQDLAGSILVDPYTNGETYTIYKGIAPTIPVLKLPANNALVTTLMPTLDWNDSSEVQALDVPGWHYEINITSPYGYNETFNTEDDADPLVGLGVSKYTFITPLPESTTFTWKVRAYNDNNQFSAWSTSRIFRTPSVTSTTKLPAPVLISPANTASPTLDNKHPTFTWDEVSGAASYTLQIMKGTSVAVTGTIKPPLHTFTPTADLLPGTVYTWKVKANGKISSDYSAPFTFTTSPNPPKIPILTLPVNSALLDSTVVQTLKWNAVLGVTTTSPATTYPAASSFQVEYAADSSFTGSTIEIVTGSTQLSLSNGTLSPNRTYYWRVRSWSGMDATGNHSFWSAVRTFRTKLTTPVLNLPINGTTLNNKRPTFTWDEVPGATTYTLQILKENPKTHLFTVVAHTGTIKAPAYVYTPTVDLLPSTVYTWKVKANGTNAGDYSAPFTFTTSGNPPKMPVLLAPANSVLVDSVVPQILKWNPVLAVITTSTATTYPAAQSYQVEYAMNSTFTGASDTLVVVNAPAAQTDPISLSPGRTYYWRVRSWSGAGATGNHSAWSLVRTIKVKFVTPALTSPAPGDTNVPVRPTFTWSSAGNGLWTNFTLQVATNDKFTTGLRSFTINAPTTSYTIPATLPALTPTTQYYWRVKINGLYTPITSSSQSFTTAP